MAFLGYPRRHRIDPETRCETSAHRAPNECMDTLLEPEHRQNRWVTTEA